MADPTSFISTEKENVVIQAGACTVTVLPQFGGKIASILVGEQELLQPPLAPIAARTHTMRFDAGDASGWDECLPSVAPCTIPLDGERARVPDHGDLWRVPWQEVNGDGDAASVTLRGACFSLPLELERGITLKKTGKGFLLAAAYTLTNLGRKAAPWSWAVHPLFTAVAGDRIHLPATIRTLLIEGSGGNRLGNPGETVSWPIATLPGGGTTDLGLAQTALSGIGDKLFAGPLAADENWCALERPSAGVRLRMTFDTGENPYLGLWLCYGGWPEGPGPKQTCVALEPATAPVDSLAHTGSWSRILKPGESVQWRINLEIESL